MGAEREERTDVEDEEEQPPGGRSPGGSSRDDREESKKDADEDREVSTKAADQDREEDSAKDSWLSYPHKGSSHGVGAMNGGRVSKLGA